ncbi:N-acetylmannosamine-6-phosphate 2-epimerase [Jiangella sp. DSM 45060]|uniref:N-acetylmannosamine-6-phosphate 2-epimerase n=1 Tax=Jiangella sp. DSM 45060 TaxID=1798224 RepID=UPI00087C51E4|nr:putative N-acetylmannosamine-6-phosphate 2-epimerase [Jiangella sp. DSM 45060]SDS87906.1 N-acylglucosamine-6-phosphate 2-epimerase [Jiangella sp. DSM 45060]
MSVISRLAGGLIVSCQAPVGSPLRQPAVMAAMASAAELAGAVGIRAEGAADIAAIKNACTLPVIGIRKRQVPGSDVRITPTLADALPLLDAGADLIALDASDRPRPGGERVSELIAALDARGVPVMADVGDFRRGVAAAGAGAALVATTLAPSPDPSDPDAPDVGLVRRLAESGIDAPIVAEGRYATPEAVAVAFAAGAHAIVVGTAITDTLALARRLCAATPAFSGR